MLKAHRCGEEQHGINRDHVEEPDNDLAFLTQCPSHDAARNDAQTQKRQKEL